MLVQMVIKNELGEFSSEKMPMTEKQYTGMIDVSKKFYLNDVGFEMWTENGYIIIPPEITQRSILLINILDESE